MVTVELQAYVQFKRKALYNLA